MNWKITNIKPVIKTRPFLLEEVQLTKNDIRLKHPYTRIAPPDWVNILPIDINGNCILIEQYRVGSNKIVLEIPGGVVDPEDSGNMSSAALRELEEETGYTSNKVIHLASLNPNPAIQTNLVHFFVALDCSLQNSRQHFPDADEDINLKFVPKETLPTLVRSGKMDHCLSALCILMSEKYLQ